MSDSTGCSPFWDGVSKVFGWIAVGVLAIAATAAVVMGTGFSGGLRGAALVVEGQPTTLGGIIASEASSWITDFLRWLLT